MPRDYEILKHWRPEPPSDREREALRTVERGDFEIYRNKMELICWEAYQSFARMGISPMIEGGDAAVGIYTRQGDLGVGIMGTQLHLINGALGVKYMMRHFFEEPSIGVRPGDMFYVNDPAYGGIHNSDQILFLPLFRDGVLVAWVAAASHETETGATEPGGNPPSAKTRFDEGLLLPPIRIAENYQLKADLMEMMEHRVRDPRMQTLDIKARAAAVSIMERRCHEIMDRKGVDFFIGSLLRMVQEGSQTARRKLASMNDGVYRSTAFLDSGGANKYGLIGTVVEVEKRGEEATVRFFGSPRIVNGNFNIWPHAMIAQTACYFFQYFFWELPNTTGFYEPLHFEFQEGSFFLPDFDDATSLCTATQANVQTALHMAFEKMKFGSPEHDNVIASWGGASCVTAIGGVTRDGMPYGTWDQGQLNGQGMGGRWDSDGIDVGGFIWCAIGEFLDSEPFEHNYPVLPIFRSTYWKDAMGYGKFRGGRSMNGMWRIHNTPFAAAVPMGGYSARPVANGLFGGYPGRPVGVAFIRHHNLDDLIAEDRVPRDIYEAVERIEGDWATRHTISQMEMLENGDLVIVTAPSGPGYGDVLDRDPELVMKDLREESISPRTATEIYRVVYREDNLVVDTEATELARKQERAARVERGVPYEQWIEGWLTKQPPAEVLEYFGEWPRMQSTGLVDFEPERQLLEPRVREYGDPVYKTSRY